MSVISGIGNISSNLLPNTSQTTQTDTGDQSFAGMLKGFIEQTDALQKQSDDTALKFASGQIDNIHDVMIASEKASLSFDLTVQVRNKLLDAYQELMRMQV